ncbi:MAG: hypothetical protein AAF403_07225, partial [Pseudomonadota bacterium]
MIGLNLLILLLLAGFAGFYILWPLLKLVKPFKSTKNSAIEVDSSESTSDSVALKTITFKQPAIILLLIMSASILAFTVLNRHSLLALQSATPTLTGETRSFSGFSDEEIMALDDETRQQMIKSMVKNLETRLQNEDANDATGWKRLARAYMVMGEVKKGDEAFERAYVLGAISIDELVLHARILRQHQQAKETSRTFELSKRILEIDSRHFEGRLFYAIGLIALGQNEHEVAQGKTLLEQLFDEFSDAPAQKQNLMKAVED